MKRFSTAKYFLRFVYIISALLVLISTIVLIVNTDDNPGIKPRIPMSGVFFEDKYDVEKAKAGVNEYDNIYNKYLSERDTNARDSNWSKSISDMYLNSIQMSKDDYPLLKQQGYINIENKEN